MFETPRQQQDRGGWEAKRKATTFNGAIFCRFNKVTRSHASNRPGHKLAQRQINFDEQRTMQRDGTTRAQNVP